MAYQFIFPDVGEGVHEGEIVKWFVKEGDKVKADQSLGEVETDKAVVEMPSPKAGTILKVHVPEGKIIKVGEIMVTILEEGENLEDAKKQLDEKKDAPYTGSVVGFVEEAKGVSPIYGQKPSATTASSETIQATPAVRILARQLNVDLSKIRGTGTAGRIIEEDVQKAASAEKETLAPGISRNYDAFGSTDKVPLRGIKRTTANRMAQSIFTAAQVTNMNEADVTELSALREKEKAAYEKEGLKLTLMPYLIKAAALALKDHPYLNASLEGEEIILKKYYNISIAVDTEEGLFVPVIKNANEKPIKSIAQEMHKLVNDVKTRKVNIADLKGGSFSISNLGSFGVEFFTPILNYPESAILGVGRVVDKPVVRNGQIGIRKIMPLSLTYDHRIVDGAQAARFMNDLIERLRLCEFE